MASSCSRGGLGGALEEIYLLKGFSRIGIGCPRVQVAEFPSLKMFQRQSCGVERHVFALGLAEIVNDWTGLSQRSFSTQTILWLYISKMCRHPCQWWGFDQSIYAAMLSSFLLHSRHIRLLYSNILLDLILPKGCSDFRNCCALSFFFLFKFDPPNDWTSNYMAVNPKIKASL